MQHHQHGQREDGRDGAKGNPLDGAPHQAAEPQPLRLCSDFGETKNTH